jgi:hypothetical protein
MVLVAHGNKESILKNVVAECEDGSTHLLCVTHPFSRMISRFRKDSVSNFKRKIFGRR